MGEEPIRQAGCIGAAVDIRTGLDRDEEMFACRIVQQFVEIANPGKSYEPARAEWYPQNRSSATALNPRERNSRKAEGPRIGRRPLPVMKARRRHSDGLTSTLKRVPSYATVCCDLPHDATREANRHERPEYPGRPSDVPAIEGGYLITPLIGDAEDAPPSGLRRRRLRSCAGRCSG